VVEHERRELCVASGRCAYRADDDMLVGVVLAVVTGLTLGTTHEAPGRLSGRLGEVGVGARE